MDILLQRESRPNIYMVTAGVAAAKNSGKSVIKNNKKIIIKKI